MSDTNAPDLCTDADLQPSKLGTKEYWDNVYEQEIANFEDFGDEGEVWFGQESVEKMVDWVLSNLPPPSGSPPHEIIELGSGNGNLLFALADAGYDAARLAGIDYSADAIRLARKIAEERGNGNECEPVFEEVDFLNADLRDLVPSRLLSSSRARGGSDQSNDENGGGTGGECEGKGWTLVLDKGTYDAIALAEKDAKGRKPCDSYPERVGKLVEPGGFFLITSCNFTKEELLRAFETKATGLSYHSEIDFPSISFGGVKGSTYCSIALQKTGKTE